MERVNIDTKRLVTVISEYRRDDGTTFYRVITSAGTFCFNSLDSVLDFTGYNSFGYLFDK